MEDNSTLIEELLGQAGKSLQKELIIPEYKGVSTAGAKKEMGKASKSRDELSNQVDETKATINASNAEIKAGIKESGQAGADAAYAEQAQRQTVAEAHQTANQIFGLDKGIAVLAKQNADAKPGMDQELAVIKEMQSTGPLDNPLEWIFNGLQLPSRIQKYNTSAVQYNNNEEQISKGIQDATNMGMALEKGVPTMTVAQAKAKADLVLAEAKKLAGIADQQATIHLLDASNKKLVGDLAVAGQNIHLTELDISQAAKRYESQINGIKLAESHTQRLLQAAQMYEKLDDIKVQKVALNSAALILGYPEGSITPAMIRNMGEKGKELLAVGLAQNLGNTALDAYETGIKLKFGPDASEDTIRVVRFVGEQLGSLKKGLMDQETFKRLSKDEQRAAVNQALNMKISSTMAEAEKPGNFFHELSPAKFLAINKDLIDTPLGKALQPIAAKDQELIPSTVTSTLLEANGGNATSAGAMLADYYKQNIVSRNAVVPYRNAGGIVPDNNYIVHLRGKAYDLTKPGDATKYTIVTANEAKLTKMFQGERGGEFQ